MTQRQINPKLALEMTMRDVLGNLEELASGYGFEAMEGEFEILGIEPAEEEYVPPFTATRMTPRNILTATLSPLPLHHRAA